MGAGKLARCKAIGRRGSVAVGESLKRIGGGRWETKDGRFQIEPQSGTWVVVDAEQTDELGLPLVRGPFKLLGAAKEAIETARESGPAASPLAGRLEEAASTGEVAPAAEAKRPKRAPEPKQEPKPEPEPAWLRDLKPGGRQRARELIEKLSALGVDDPAAIARSEIAEGKPAMAQLALERRIRAAIGRKRDPEAAVRAAVEVIVAGQDEELGVGWGLVDDRSRPIDELDLES
jgi:hypothetical protein